MLGILTDVQEKFVSSQVNALIPPTGGAAFPKAPHRKLSKVLHTLHKQHTMHVSCITFDLQLIQRTDVSCTLQQGVAM